MSTISLALIYDVIDFKMQERLLKLKVSVLRVLK